MASELKWDHWWSRPKRSEDEAAREAKFSAALADFERLVTIAGRYNQVVKDKLHRAVVQSRESGSRDLSRDRPSSEPWVVRPAAPAGHSELHSVGTTRP
jgi:hypothetical protein